MCPFRQLFVVSAPPPTRHHTALAYKAIDLSNLSSLLLQT